MIIFIPIVRRQWGEAIISIPEYYRDIKATKHTNLNVCTTRMLLSIVFILTIPIFFLLTPLAPPFLIKDNKKREKIKEEMKEVEDWLNEGNLYFQHIGGTGEIQCLDCNYHKEIVSFIHGLNTSITGLQCQSCGQFHSITDWHNNIHCDCGGILEKEKPLFCPECKSKRMQYNMRYIT